MMLSIAAALFSMVMLGWTYHSSLRVSRAAKEIERILKNE